MNPILTVADMLEIRSINPIRVVEMGRKLTVDAQHHQFKYEVPLAIRYNRQTHKLVTVYTSLDVIVGSATYWASMFKGIHSLTLFGQAPQYARDWEIPFEHMGMILYKGARYER